MTVFRKTGRGVGRCAALLGVIVWSALDFGVNRGHRQNVASRARWLQRTCRRALRVLAVNVEAFGQPTSGAVIVANHLGYLDILVLAAQTPVVFVSKREVRGWPLFGWFAERAGTRFINRQRRGDVRRIGGQLDAVIAADVSLVIFLEGTSSDGRQVLPFKSSLLEPVVRCGWRVAPAYLAYAVEPGRSVEQEVCWWGEMQLLPHVWNFTTLRSVEGRLYWGDPVHEIDDRKKLASELHRRVLHLKDRATQVSALSPV